MLAETLMSIGASLTANAIDRQLVRPLNFFERRKINSKIDEIVAAVMEPTAGFFEAEQLSESDVSLISNEVTICVKWITENQEFAFSRGLEGDIITRDLLIEKPLPINSEAVSSHPAAFETLLRACIDLAVRVPPIFVEWEKSSFQAVFRQTEEIKGTLSSIYTKMKEVTSAQGVPIGTFEKIVNHRAAQKVLKISIHGLRQSNVPQAELDSLFVFPKFVELIPEVSDSDDALLRGEERDIEKFEDFLSMVGRAEKSIITAPAGAGKTTFSNWLISKLLNHSKSVFLVVLPLRRISKLDELPSLFECVSREISSVFRDIVYPKTVSDWADEGRISLIFEGFDEVNEGQRDRVVDWINQLRDAHPGLSTIITSRPLSTQHASKLFDQNWRNVRLLPFDFHRVVTYIERFQEHGPEIQTGAKLREPEALARTWLSDSTLGPLTGNPLLLSTLLIVHHMDGELPDDRAKLYDRYIDGMLGLWELNKDLAAPSVPLTKEQKKKLLELIAINMISIETDAVSEEDVAVWLESYLKEQALPQDIRGILDHLRERSGLLIGPGQYTFAHKSIGEFLVAQACNDGIQVNFRGDRFDRMYLMDRCTSDRWNTVVFLWAGLASKAEVQQFISSLIAKGLTGLAGGLLVERRKFLDRQWLKSAFWSWLKKIDLQPDIKEEYGDTYLEGPGPTKLTSIPDGRIQLRRISSVDGRFDFDFEVVAMFYSENLCSFDEWSEYFSTMSTRTWFILSRYVNPELRFFEVGSKILSRQTMCFAVFDSCRTGLNSFWTSFDERPAYQRPECEICDAGTYEVLVFLSRYLSLKEYVIRQKSRKEQDSYSYDDLFSEEIEDLKNAGFLERALSWNVQELSTEFFEILNDTLQGRELDEAAPHSGINPKAGTLAGWARRLSEVKIDFDIGNRCERYIEEILVENDRRLK